MSAIIVLILRGLATASLYAFLGLAFYLLWKDLQRQTTLVATRRPPTLTLLRQAEEEMLALQFTLPEVTIGRDPACDFVLDDSTVSARHTRLSFRQGQWWVEDLRSTNGTFLNLEPVAEPLVVANGDELRCGQAIFTITVGDDQ
jgi:pSer/pThr/pTyr-binding forkhead associated (FHA) protein